MKNCWIVLFGWLASCAAPVKPDAVVQGDSRFVPDTTKQRLLKIIEGGWLNEAYTDAFRRFKSPMAAASYGLPRQQLAFDITRLEGDTLVNCRGQYNYNESQRFDVVFYKKADGHPGMRINEHRNYVFSRLLLDYTIENNDTILLLTITGKDSTVTERFRRGFRKFPEADGIPVNAMEYFVNTNLFAGDWKMGNETVSFRRNGLVKFRGYNHYAVTTEHHYSGSRPDEITFYNDTSGVTFAFTTNHGKLQFYEMEERGDEVSFSRGKMVGELERL